MFKASVELELGDASAALETAQRIFEEEDRYGANEQSLIIASIAAARLGDDTRAQTLADAYRERTAVKATPGPRRFLQFLEGELARIDGDFETAITHFNEAESMLAPRGEDGIHTLIWYALATAHRQAGNRGEALMWYERIADARAERLFEPILYIRSFYFVGQLRLELGSSGDAEDAFERFLEHWEDGEIDRERIREVESLLD